MLKYSGNGNSFARGISVSVAENCKSQQKIFKVLAFVRRGVGGSRYETRRLKKC